MSAEWMKMLRLRGCAMAFMTAAGWGSVRDVWAAGADNPLNGALAIKSQDAVVFVPIAAETVTVAWAESPIRVDGDLSDWIGVPPLVFDNADHTTWSQGAYRGKDDLSVALRLGRDEACLYVSLEIEDDREPMPDRVEIGFAPADSPLITTWRDVGMRYGADDVHAIFGIGAGGAVSLRWAHIQQRMDGSVIANAFGTEAERLAFIEQGPEEKQGGKVFSQAVRRKSAGGHSVTCFEAAFPWRSLMPYDPVCYAPLKFNIVVHDADEGKVPSKGTLGWKPGLIGTYSAAHFATLAFLPPPGRTRVDGYAQLPKVHYLNEKINAAFSFYNPAAETIEGELALYDADHAATNPLARAKIALPKGVSRTVLAVHSETVGKTNLGFRARLRIEGRPVQSLAVHAPTLDGSVFIQPVQEVLDAIARIERNASILSNLYDRVVAKGLDPTYPMAYRTLQEMFVARCKGDLKGGKAQLVLDNEAYLAKLFTEHKARMETLLRDPEMQLKVPARSFPETLKIKNGFYYDGEKPVFLWGPCVFWWMKSDQPYAWKLGYNSVGPELPIRSVKDHLAVSDYLENFRTNGMLVNVSLADANFDAFKKEHPEAANVDRNNFLPILIQHPLVREEIRRRMEADIACYKDFPAVRSYWLWNEPDYVNFSEATRLDFIDYLRPKYKTISALNARWRSGYASFEDIRIARGLDSANQAPWVDYQTFINGQLADFFRFLNRTAKEVDPSRPTHTKYMCISAAFFNIETLQGINDICGHDGNSGPRDLLFLDLCRSLYPDKPLVNTEIHIWYKDYFLVSLVPWRLALHGLADGNWWCWHANERFSKTVGCAESMHALTIPALDVRRLFDPYIHALVTKPKHIATLFQDVVAGRSWGLVDNLRYQIAPAQYSLGVQPFYATEAAIVRGVLKDHPVLIATESGYVRESVYEVVVDYVKGGGTLIVLPGSFAANEYGDPRDTSGLIPSEGGDPYDGDACAVRLGKGRVIRIDRLDGTVPGAKPDNNKRQAVYRRVLHQAMSEAGLLDPVRLRPAADDPDALFGWDIRCARVGDAYALCALPQDRWEMSELNLETDRPVRRMVNLITGMEVPVESFKLNYGANLFLIELEK